MEGRVYGVIRSISGLKVPVALAYWAEHVNVNLNIDQVVRYSQFATYYVGYIVKYNDVV